MAEIFWAATKSVSLIRAGCAGAVDSTHWSLVVARRIARLVVARSPGRVS
jgi:hypothetical protein